MSMIPVRVGGLAIDERTKNPVVLLQEIEGNRVLPIWIGPMEASAIHSELSLDQSKSTLLRLADAAMYVAKETGRNQTAVAGKPVRRQVAASIPGGR